MSSRQGGGRIPAAKSGELYSLKWDSYQGHITQGLQRFFAESDALRDVTIGSEGQYIRSHKLVLSLCSPYFKDIFESSSTQRDSSGAMMVLLEHIKFKDLKNVIHFIYNGEIKMSNSDLKGFLRAGELLQIEGLVKSGKDDGDSESAEPSPPPPKKPATVNSAASTQQFSKTDSSSAASTQQFTQPGPSSSAVVAIPSSSSASYSYPVAGHSGSSQSQPRPPKRTRLGRIIKPTIPDVEYDEEVEEEVETDLLALESSSTVVVQENSRLMGTGPIGGGAEDIVTIKTEGDMAYMCDDEDVDGDGAIGGTSNSNMSTFEEGHSSSHDADMYNQTYDYEQGGDQEVAGPSSAIAIAQPGGSQQTKTPGLTLIKTRYGNPGVCFNGYSYGLERVKRKKIYWQCFLKKSKFCYGRLHTTPDMLTLLEEVGEHSHLPSDSDYYGN